MARTRNQGFSRARTKYVFVLDADNLLYPRCVEALVSALENSDAAFAYGYIEKFGDVRRLQNTRKWNPHSLARGNTIDAMVLLRKSIWKTVGGYSTIEVMGWEDFDLWFKIARRKGRGILVPEILARYRVHITFHAQQGHQSKRRETVALLRVHLSRIFCGGDPASESLILEEISGEFRRIGVNEGMGRDRISNSSTNERRVSGGVSGRTDRNAVIVAGMHESGGTAIARLLRELGVDWGRRSVATSNNDSGTVEHAAIHDTHERLLRHLGSSWDGVLPLPTFWWESPDIAQYKRELVEIIQSAFSNSALWGFEDPSVCRLLPLWHIILAETQTCGRFLIPFRDPLNVAGALSLHNGFTVGKSCLLWLRYLLDAEKATRGDPRLFVDYERISKDWRGLVSGMESGLRIEFPITLDGVPEELDSLLQSPTQQRNGRDSIPRRDETFSKWVESIFAAAKKAVTHGEDAVFSRTSLGALRSRPLRGRTLPYGRPGAPSATHRGSQSHVRDHPECDHLGDRGPGPFCASRSRLATRVPLHTRLATRPDN